MQSVDDRGRPVKLRRLPRGTPTRSDNPPLRVATAQQRRFQSVARSHRSTGLFILAIVLFFIFIRSMFVAENTLVLLMLGFVAVGVFLLTRRISRVDSIHHMTSLRICPGCGYDLHGSHSESDGCTVCPECGAAWRLPADQSSNPSS